jgi:hypothetical protein
MPGMVPLKDSKFHGTFRLFQDWKAIAACVHELRQEWSLPGCGKNAPCPIPSVILSTAKSLVPL